MKIKEPSWEELSSLDDFRFIRCDGEYSENVSIGEGNGVLVKIMRNSIEKTYEADYFLDLLLQWHCMNMDLQKNVLNKYLFSADAKSDLQHYISRFSEWQDRIAPKIPKRYNFNQVITKIDAVMENLKVDMEAQKIKRESRRFWYGVICGFLSGCAVSLLTLYMNRVSAH